MRTSILDITPPLVTTQITPSLHLCGHPVQFIQMLKTLKKNLLWIYTREVHEGIFLILFHAVDQKSILRYALCRHFDQPQLLALKHINIFPSGISLASKIQVL